LEEFLLSRKIYGPFESFPSPIWGMLTPGAKLEEISKFHLQRFHFRNSRANRLKPAKCLTCMPSVS
jgi:hypothetical protein